MSTAEEMNMVTAVRHALHQEIARDRSVRLVGYDIGPVGGMFRATDGLYDEFGDEQIIDTALTENGILGMAVGMAIAGDRPIVEMQFLAFLYNAWGQLLYNVANLHQKSGGLLRLPLTIRTVFGGGIRPLPFHSESTESWLMHTPGLRVVCPSSPYQAKGLLAAAVRCDDPVIFLEHAKLYRSMREAVPLAEYVLPLDKCRLVQAGTDVTILAWGNMLHVACAAARMVAASSEIIDVCSLAPLDIEPILESVRRTGRCVIVHEARRTCGPGAELIALINEYALEWLHAPVRRVTGFDVGFPQNQTEDHYLPGPRRVQAALEALLAYQS